jgi:hypothetical protein
MLRPKVDFAHRFCRWTQAARELNISEGMTIEAKSLDRLVAFSQADDGLNTCVEARKDKLDELGHGINMFPEIFEVHDLLRKMDTHHKLLLSQAAKEVQEVVDKDAVLFDATVPSSELLNNPHVLTSKELLERIVSNLKHADIPSLVTRMIERHDLLKDRGLYKDLRKQTAEQIKQGKLAVGAHFALKKLSAIQKSDSEVDRGDIASSAMAKVKGRGILLPVHLTKALESFIKVGPKPSGKAAKAPAAKRRKIS